MLDHAWFLLSTRLGGISLSLSLSLTLSRTHIHIPHVSCLISTPLKRTSSTQTRLTPRDLPLWAQPEDYSSLPRTSPPISFPIAGCSSLPVHPLYSLLIADGSSRQLKEVTLYSHARQGETPQSKRDTRWQSDNYAACMYECRQTPERSGEEGIGKGSRKLPAYFVVTCGLVLHFHSANCLFIESLRHRHELPVARLNTRLSFFLSMCSLFHWWG